MEPTTGVVAPKPIQAELTQGDGDRQLELAHSTIRPEKRRQHDGAARFARAGTLGALLVLMAAACGSDVDPAPIQASCSQPALGACTDYNGGLTSAQLQQVQAQCTGTWSPEPCSAAGVVGSCTYQARADRGMEILGVSQVVRVYASSAVASSAGDLCASGELFSINATGSWAGEH